SMTTSPPYCSNSARTSSGPGDLRFANFCIACFISALQGGSSCSLTTISVSSLSSSSYRFSQYSRHLSPTSIGDVTRSQHRNSIIIGPYDVIDQCYCSTFTNY